MKFLFVPHVCIFCVLINVLVLTHSSTQVRADGIKKIQGWTEVKPHWPLQESNYFIATERGHHFIEVKLPKDLNQDLDVSLHYYYSYARAKPVIQMTPCDKNVLIVGEGSADTNNRWVTHKEIVMGANCRKRNELAFNVLLHDAGDVFAWKFMQIEGRADPAADSVPTVGPPTSGDETKASSQGNHDSDDELLDEHIIIDDKPKSDVKPESSIEGSKREEFLQTPQPRAADEGSKLRLTTIAPVVETQTESSDYGSMQKPNTPKTMTSTDIENNKPDSSGRVVDDVRSNTVELDKQKLENNLRDEHEPSQNNDHTKSSKKTQEDDSSSRSEKSEEDDNSKSPGYIPAPHRVTREDEAATSWLDYVDSRRENPKDPSTPKVSDSHRRIKRFVATEKVGRLSMICKVESCDLRLFKMARFTRLINGIPKLPEGAILNKEGKKYFLMTNSAPLRFELESKEHDLTDVDTCINFDLYMDKNAELELLIRDSDLINSTPITDLSSTAAALRGRSLEIIKSSTPKKWEAFNRCVSDYLPRLTTQSEDDTVEFILKPKTIGPDKQIAILVDPKQAASIRELHKTVEFIPDVKNLESASEVEKFWVMDKDGVRKPTIGIEQDSDVASSSSGAPPSTQVLKVSNISPNQESFDITSRWLRVKDAAIINEPILFVYNADKEDWIRSVEFQYQRAGDSLENWISQEAYSSLRAPYTEENIQENTDTKQLDLPIRIKGLDSAEFRVRIRHHMKKFTNPHPIRDRLDRQLTVRKLAFADACSTQNYCLNGGACTPTGPVQAECKCRQGYSGSYCEKVKPCEVKYGSQSGYDLCRSLGAKCDEKLPVMRCVWPNDKYYKCKATYTVDTSGSVRANSAEASESEVQKDDSNSLENLPFEEQAKKLKSTVSEQAKLIIILGVFIVAISIFAIVLIGSMVTRLQKSKQRLEQSKTELHDMSRRIQPSTSFASSRAPEKRTGKANVISYNNSAFDVE